MNRKKRLGIVCGCICLLAVWLLCDDLAMILQMIGACTLGLGIGAVTKRVYQAWRWVHRWSKRMACIPDLGPNMDDFYVLSLMKAMDKDRVLFWLLPQQIYVKDDAKRTEALRKAFFRVLRKFHKQNYMSGWKNPSRARLEKLIRPTNNVRN